MSAETKSLYFQEATLIPEDSRIPIRPLENFSTAVVMEFPELLQSSTDKLLSFHKRKEAADLLARKAEDYATEIVHKTEFNPADPDSLLARLDVMLAHRMVRLADASVGNALATLVKTYSPPLYIPDATYGDLLFGNRREDPRTLSGDKREADFYFIHEDTEVGLHKFSTALTDFLEGKEYTIDKYEYVMESTQHLDDLVSNMEILRSKLTGFNDVIRPALMSIPNYPYHGPSGKDSATMYTIDLLTRGRSLPNELLTDIRDNRPYYYLPHLPLLDKAVDTSVTDGSLLDRVVQSDFDPALEDLFIIISKRLAQFRGIHTYAVGEHIPGALEGQTDGTGGVSASELKNFLLNRQAIHARPEVFLLALKHCDNPEQVLEELKIA